MFRNNSNGVVLTRVMNADRTNDRTYAKFAEDQDYAELKLQKLLDEYNTKVKLVLPMAFSNNVDDTLFKEIVTVITFWDEIFDAYPEDTPYYSANDLFFALLVNWCATNQKGVQPIRSASALNAAKDMAKSHGHDLSYTEYVINMEGEEEFGGDYLDVELSPKGYNSKFNLQVPIKTFGPKKLGMVKICTDNVPSKLKFASDNDRGTYTIPGYLWMEMMSNGVLRGGKIKFAKMESKHLAEMFNTDKSHIQEILQANDFATVLYIEQDSGFGTDFDPATGELRLDVYSSQFEIPSLDDNPSNLCWKRVGHSYVLLCPDFYVVDKTGSKIAILQVQ